MELPSTSFSNAEVSRAKWPASVTTQMNVTPVSGLHVPLGRLRVVELALLFPSQTKLFLAGIRFAVAVLDSFLCSPGCPGTLSVD